MSSLTGIKVFCRVKPSKRPCTFLSVNHEHNQIEYEIPVDLAPGIVNNTKTSHKFKFDGIFDMKSTQDEVFTRVAKEACDNALNGYNATIFAYGQTGSGKTFTITGGAERYHDRGIIPRALTYMYNEFKRRNDQQFSVYVSYLEIYNEAGYDLLDPSHETKALEELPRVTLMEDASGNVLLKNLSLHHAASDEDALNLLFTGDTNRAISETPMNMASSRSHCIFTVSIESRLIGSDTVRRSKLHLVDLAGSERVHKTHATGQLLREAGHINKSLHYLELVIKTLAERKEDYIPYRNSMMTSVLRDSLGGNCKTVMIATMNPEEEQIGESISTCRFSQRVASVKNSAIVNEETDPILVIRRLKTEVAVLKAEIALLKGEQGEAASLTEDEEELLYSTAKLWVQNSDESAPFDIGALTSTRIHCGFRMLRRVAKEFGSTSDGSSATVVPGGPSKSSGAPSAPTAASTASAHPPEAAIVSELKQLRAQLQQRDNEIAILVNMVKQAGGAKPGSAGPVPGPSAAAYYPPSGAAEVPRMASPAPITSVGAMLAASDFIDPAVLADKERAMELFMQSYPKAQAINDNKQLLKDRYATAKALADQVNAARDSINRLKKAIEVRRTERAVQSVAELADADSDTVAAAVAAMPPDAEEITLKGELDNNKKIYHESFQSLRDTKSEIERIQRVFEAGKLRMASDFESWLTNSLLRARAGGPAMAKPPSPIVATRKQPLPPVQFDPFAVPTAPAPALTTSAPPGYGGPLPAMQPRTVPQASPVAASSVPTTGNSTADADIRAFYQAREAMLRRGGVK